MVMCFDYSENYVSTNFTISVYHCNKTCSTDLDYFVIWESFSSGSHKKKN